jgi:hypothetical protein
LPRRPGPEGSDRAAASRAARASVQSGTPSYRTMRTLAMIRVLNRELHIPLKALLAESGTARRKKTTRCTEGGGRLVCSSFRQNARRNDRGCGDCISLLSTQGQRGRRLPSQFEWLGTLALPLLVFPGACGPVNSVATFVFHDASGANTIVLLRGTFGSGGGTPLDAWGVAVYPAGTGVVAADTTIAGKTCGGMVDNGYCGQCDIDVGCSNCPGCSWVPGVSITGGPGCVGALAPCSQLTPEQCVIIGSTIGGCTLQ